MFLIGDILQIIGLRLEVMYTGRVISGLGVGALSMLVPVSNLFCFFIVVYLRVDF